MSYPDILMIITNILLISLGVVLTISIYFLVRNNKVCQFRIRLLDEKKYFEYGQLPTYEEMLYKYWYILDFEKFKTLKTDNKNRRKKMKRIIRKLLCFIGLHDFYPASCGFGICPYCGKTEFIG